MQQPTPLADRGKPSLQIENDTQELASFMKALGDWARGEADAQHGKAAPKTR